MICRIRLFFLFASLLVAAAQQVAAQTETWPFIHNGYSRPYLIHRPAHLPTHPPVVFMLGGIRSTARFTSENFNWINEADRNGFLVVFPEPVDRKSTRLNSSHMSISYAVFCLKKKKKKTIT